MMEVSSACRGHRQVHARGPQTRQNHWAPRRLCPLHRRRGPAPGPPAPRAPADSGARPSEQPAAETMVIMRVALFTLGGTIASTHDLSPPGETGAPAGRPPGAAPSLKGAGLLTAIPGLNTLGIEVDVHDFLQVPGPSLTITDVIALAAAIRRQRRASFAPRLTFPVPGRRPATSASAAPRRPGTRSPSRQRTRSPSRQRTQRSWHAAL